MRWFHCFLSTSSLSGTRCSTVEPSQPQRCHQPFLQGSLIPFGGKWCLETKIYMPPVLATIGVSLLLGNLSGQTMYVFVCVGIYISIYFCVYYIFQKLFPWYLQFLSNITGFTLGFSLSITCNPASLTPRNLAPVFLNIVTYLLNPPVCNQSPILASASSPYTDVLLCPLVLWYVHQSSPCRGSR